MSASVVQNSALVLSLWHCKVAWFCTDPKSKYTKKLLNTARRDRLMESIYKGMKPLRSAIHDLEYDDNNQPLNVPEMAQHFNDIVFNLGIPKEVWAEELHSLMDEIVSTNRALKEFQQRRYLDAGGLNLNIDLDHIHKQPSYTTCLLTLWYWLAVWCSPDDEQHYSSHIATRFKHEFLSTIEANNLVLAKCLVIPSSEINNADQRLLKTLFSMLFKMLSSDLQHWIDALDHFTDKMVNAGILRGQVKKVLRAAGALNQDSTSQFSTTGTHRALTSATQEITAEPSDSSPQHKFSLKKGGLSDQVFDAVIRTPVNHVLDKLEIVIVSTIDGIKKDADKIIDRIPEIADKVGHEVVHIAKNIGQGVEHAVAQLYPEVVNLGHKIGEGMHHFAQGTKSVFHKIGHFFRSLF